MKRLAELAGQWELPASAKTALARLLELLAGSPDAPTSVTNPRQAVNTHLADSLSGLGPLRGRPSLDAIVDIGSGAGFPGLPIAIALPRTRVDLLEATGRKCVYMERVVGELGLPNARVVHDRAEQWGAGEGRARYAAALVRALAPLATLVEYGSPLLRDGGLLVAWKGRRDPAEEDRGRAAARELGLEPLEVVAPDPFSGATSRHLHLFEKVAPTPAGYPRRPGLARKRQRGG